jgi:hypothetical protein
LCQIAGFFWALAEASLARGHEFREGLPWRIWNRLFGGPPPQLVTGVTMVPHETDAVLTLGEPPNEKEVERVARELANLRSEFQYHQRHADKRLETLRTDLDRVSAELAGTISEVVQRERERRRKALRREEGAAVLFTVGVALTAVAAVG